MYYLWFLKLSTGPATVNRYRVVKHDKQQIPKTVMHLIKSQYMPLFYPLVCKYLGITLDNKMTFGPHVQGV